MPTKPVYNNSLKLFSWLFPITYVIHIAEEFLGGEGFSAYLARARGVSMSSTRFLVMNTIACVLMSLGVLIAQRVGFLLFLLACYSTVVIINGLSHTVNTLINSAYNPGTISGLLIWIPLGVFTLVRLWPRMKQKSYWGAVALGVGLHAIVTITTLSGTKVPKP